MFCTFFADFIFNGILVCLEFFFCQISECLDIYDFLEIMKRFFTLSSSVIVSGIYKAVFYFTVCDDNLCIIQFYGSVFVSRNTAQSFLPIATAN